MCRPRLLTDPDIASCQKCRGIPYRQSAGGGSHTRSLVICDLQGSGERRVAQDIQKPLIFRF